MGKKLGYYIRIEVEVIMEYREVQRIAKTTIEYAKTIIKPGMNLLHLRKLCEQKMLELGADSFCIGILEPLYLQEMKLRYRYPENIMLQVIGLLQKTIL